MGRGRDGGGLCVRGYGEREGWGRFVRVTKVMSQH